MSRNLTNLECVALAHLWRAGTCTAHELRQAFAESTAGRYSGSAGAIYPLVKRLQLSGHVGSTPAANGAQKKRLYSIKDKGKRAVASWMFAMQPREVFPDDPVRTRFQYIDLLGADDRTGWLAEAEKAIVLQDAAVREEYAAADYQTPVARHILKGVLDTNKLRRRWLKEARDLIGAGL